jgi:hypothetical protein
VVDAPPGDVGDVQQAIDAAKVHERTVIGDVLDHAFQHLAFFEALDQIGALLGAGLFEYRAARNNDVAAALIHFQNLERLRAFHQRANIAHRADIHLAAWQEGDGAVKIDGVATFHLIEDAAFDLLIGFKGLFEADPGMLAACLLARQHGLAKRIFNALKIDFNGLANLELAIGGHGTEFAHRDAPFGFRPTSMTTTSFSRDRMVPWTTEPSSKPWVSRLVSNIAAKSSRLGFMPASATLVSDT